MPPTVFVSKPAKRATPWSSWTMKSPVRRSVKQRSRPRPRRVGRVLALRRWISRCSGTTASLSPGATKPSRRLASSKTRPALRAVPARLDAREVVGGALAAALVRPRDERRVVGADELLELRLGLAEAAGGELGGLRAELERLGAGDRREPQRRARVELGEDAVRLDVEVVRVGVVEGGADVVPVVAQRGLDVLLGGEDRARRRRAAGRAGRGSRRRAAARRCPGARRGSPARRSRPARGARRRARRRARSRRRRCRRGSAA